MAARIVWWMLTLGILTVFHLPVTKEQEYICRKNVNGCHICKNPKATKDDCLSRFCVNKKHQPEQVCIKHDYEEKRKCGIHPPENIVGCSQVNEGNWPWQVSLQTSSYNHVCGGVLIDNDWVLAAAHCVHKSDAKDLIVVHGNLKRKSAKGKFRRFKHIFVHPNFEASFSYPNDVALIQLENDAHSNEYVSPICLPSFGDVFSSNSCSIAGWGVPLDSGDKIRLHVRKVTPMKPDECGKYNSVKVLHICLHYAWPDICFGNGSPLSCARSSDGRFVVIGVHSLFSHFVFGRHYLDRYTNIRTFVPWINEIMHSTKEKP